MAGISKDVKDAAASKAADNADPTGVEAIVPSPQRQKSALLSSRNPVMGPRISRVKQLQKP
jgi:hypothetical protein